MTSRRTRRIVVATAGAVGVACAAMVPLSADADSGTNTDLAAARAATAKYHDEARALADGYLSTDECVASPSGAMGYHYVNPALFDAPMDVRTPPILLYQSGEDGGRKLVAVEYFKADEDQDVDTDGDRPSLFGTEFDGPMAGHDDGMPIHYDLHVWLWQHNPDGMFAEFNPAGSC